MLLSMTGYGKGVADFNSKKITTEIRSLNGKVTDVRLKSPIVLGEKEMELRKLILQHAQRGKLEVVISLDGFEDIEAGELNKPVIRKYYQQLRTISEELGVRDDQLFQTILRLPNVIKGESKDIDSDFWEALILSVTTALNNLRNFRKQEGDSLRADLSRSCQTILDLLDQVEPHEAARIEVIRTRLRSKLDEFLGDEQVDQNRFEQEVVFYLDKMDINEEKVRLRQHCTYFLEVLSAPEDSKGRQLNFIGQEIGREINTLGAKAQWGPLQKVVVQMKNELDKIKEQLANSL